MYCVLSLFICYIVMTSIILVNCYLDRRSLLFQRCIKLSIPSPPTPPRPKQPRNSRPPPPAAAQCARTSESPRPTPAPRTQWQICFLKTRWWASIRSPPGMPDSVPKPRRRTLPPSPPPPTSPDAPILRRSEQLLPVHDSIIYIYNFNLQ